MHEIPVKEMEDIARVVSFYSHLGRGLTPEEIWRLMPPGRRPENTGTLLEILDAFERAGFLERHDNVWALRHRVYGSHGECLDFAERRRTFKRIQNEKWQKINHRTKLFSFIPFLDFALVSGSVSWESAGEYSDFDVVLGCKNGRVFTVRFFAHLVFGFLGISRRANDSRQKSKDKFCFSHFVVPAGYRLSGPYTFAWQEIYRNMVPIYGDENLIVSFFRVNNWAERANVIFDYRWVPARRNIIRSLLEFFSGGIFGDVLEQLLRWFQVKRISKLRFQDSPAADGLGRVYVGDDELEFHGREPDFRQMLNQVEEHLENVRAAMF